MLGVVVARAPSRRRRRGLALGTCWQVWHTRRRSRQVVLCRRGGRRSVGGGGVVVVVVDDPKELLVALVPLLHLALERRELLPCFRADRREFLGLLVVLLLLLLLIALDGVGVGVCVVLSQAEASATGRSRERGRSGTAAVELGKRSLERRELSDARLELGLLAQERLAEPATDLDLIRLVDEEALEPREHRSCSVGLASCVVVHHVVHVVVVGVVHVHGPRARDGRAGARATAGERVLVQEAALRRRGRRRRAVKVCGPLLVHARGYVERRVCLHLVQMEKALGRRQSPSK